MSRIGEGSNSSVFKVKRIKDDSIYALKKVKLEKMTSKEIQNSINEVRFLASIRHPNVISYKEAFFDPNSHSLWYRTQYPASLWSTRMGETS
jgi:NIMA (never in mitosis gene a)-related kinase 1/4/5